MASRMWPTGRARAMVRRPGGATLDRGGRAGPGGSAAVGLLLYVSFLAALVMGVAPQPVATEPFR